MKIVDDFEDAVRVHEMKGAACPGDWDAIEDDFKDAKKRLVSHVQRLRKELMDYKRRSRNQSVGVSISRRAGSNVVGGI